MNDQVPAPDMADPRTVSHETAMHMLVGKLSDDVEASVLAHPAWPQLVAQIADDVARGLGL